jgi:hypothetical protein
MVMPYSELHELRLRPGDDGGYVIEHYGVITEAIKSERKARKRYQEIKNGLEKPASSWKAAKPLQGRARIKD